jgi:outer membrane receptor protein involved in Fe transport
VNHPLVLRTAPGNGEEVELVNAEEPTRTQGIDLSARYRMQPLRLTASYSYIDAMRPVIAELFGDGFSFDTTMRRAVPLNPRHAVSLEAAHERENDRIMAVALHFVGRQTLSDTLSTATHPYVTVDARFEKHVGRAVLFVGGTNLTGVHQTQFLPVLLRASGPAGQWTGDVWTPLGGPVINAGLRLKY